MKREKKMYRSAYFFLSGVQLKGKVKSFDSFTVLLVSENRSQLIYKHAISTIQRI